jgi:hypothetical protein
MMTHPDLAAFIPTNAVDAQKVGWGAMPFPAILAALERRAEGRVIRADDPWIKQGPAPSFKGVPGALRRVDKDPSDDRLWVELDIS